MFSIFKDIFKSSSKALKKTDLHFIHTDIHSHLLAGIDDGSQSLTESAELIKQFKNLGYQKLITTPHIMSDFYLNTPAIIAEKLADLQFFLQKMNIEITIEAAAEYYLDEIFIRKIENNHALLTFGKNYLLFETGFANQPTQLMQTIFLLQSQSYKPVFAHPERYIYLQKDFDLLREIYSKGVYLQINLSSLLGYYGKSAKELAEKMIDKKMVAFVGSDCHAMRHLEAIEKVQNLKYFRKLANLNILNNQL